MNEGVEFIVWGVLIGVGGSALMDVWALLLRRAFKVPTLEYALLGRWICYFPRGRFFHVRIAASDPIRGERCPWPWESRHLHMAIDTSFRLTRQRTS
jgi:hypothetical protein